MKKIWYVWRRIDGRVVKAGSKCSRSSAIRKASDQAAWFGAENIVISRSNNPKHVYEHYFKEE